MNFSNSHQFGAQGNVPKIRKGAFLEGFPKIRWKTYASLRERVRDRQRNKLVIAMGMVKAFTQYVDFERQARETEMPRNSTC